MKKTLFSSIVVLLILSGCNLIDPSPKDVLTKYLNSHLKGNYSEAYVLLSSKDKNFKNQKEYEAEFRVNPFAKAFAGKISFNVKDVKMSGDTAEATIEITAPDFTEAISELMGLAFASALREKNDEETEKMITEKFKDRSFPIKTTTEKHNLVKEREGWRVFLNWEGQKKAKDATEQAAQMEKSKKFAEAKAKYQEALSLDKNNETAQKRLAEIDKEIEAYKAKQAYFDKIEVRNIHLGTDILDRFGVFGELKNNGERTLKQVEITIYCLDKNDTIVFEKTYHPVLVTEHLFMGDNTPLKSNYSRRFGCRLDDAPSDWNKKVRVVVTDVEFQ